MPTLSEQFNSNILLFNEKYNVTFSTEEFLEKAQETDQNTAYWNVYSKLATTLADKKIAGENLPSLQEMLSDYESMLFIPYREMKASEGMGENAPEPFGSVDTQRERSEMLRTALRDKKIFEYQYIAKKYKSGELRIRDMVTLARDETGKDGSMSKENAVEILKYALALEEANKSRSFIWKIFHPFRNNAEQRDSALIKSLVASKFELNFNDVLKQAKSSPIPQFEADMTAIKFHIQQNTLIDDAVIEEYGFANENEEIKFVFSEEELNNANDLNLEEDILQDELNKSIMNQEFVNEDGLGEAENFIIEQDIDVANYDSNFLLDDENIERKQAPIPAPPKQNEVKQDEVKQARPENPLLRIGYRPSSDLKEIRKEGNEFKKLNYQAKKENNISPAKLAVLELNYNRYLNFYGAYSGHDPSFATIILKNREETYAQEDATLRERFPSYDPLPKEDVKAADAQERVNINLDLKEDKEIHKSEPLEQNAPNIAPPFADK